jgi:mannose-1-phosphate guanylyltransferase
MPIREAVVLAAGLGTRMRPLTDRVPKPALAFLNRPVLHWTLESLEAFGVRRVLINLHHLPQEVMACVGDYAGGLDVKYSLEPEILGTAGAFQPLRGLLQEDSFLVVNGDVFHRLDYGRLEAELDAHPEALVCLALRSGAPGYTGVDLRPDGTIAAFGQGPYLFTGVYAARSELVALLPGSGRRELVPDLLRPLLPSGLVRGLVEDAAWEDLGAPGPFLEATLRSLAAMEEGSFPVPEGSSLETRDGHPLLRHHRAWVSRDATLLGPVTAGAGVRVEAQAHLGRAVLFPGTKIGRKRALFSVLVSPDAVLEVPPPDSSNQG